MPFDEAMQPITLYPSRKKQLLLLAVALAFVVASLVMVVHGDKIGWFPLVFFGLCAIVFFITLLPTAAYLRLEEDGFTFVSLFKKSKIRWADVECFYPGRVGRNRMVLFDFITQRKSRMQQVSVAICGHDGGLPDTYGMSTEALAELLNHWEQRHQAHAATDNAMGG